MVLLNVFLKVFLICVFINILNDNQDLFQLLFKQIIFSNNYDVCANYLYEFMSLNVLF